MKNNNEQTTKPLPANDFGGTLIGKNNTIKTFFCDINKGEGGVFYYGDGYMFTIHSTERQVFSLSSPFGFLIGTGNIFSNEAYMEYLNTFSKEVLDKMKEKFQEFSFSSDNPLLFGVNNTMRLIQGRTGLYYLYYPDNSNEIISDLNNERVFSKEILDKHNNLMGNIIGSWLRDQFKFMEGVNKRLKNIKSYIHEKN